MKKLTCAILLLFTMTMLLTSCTAKEPSSGENKNPEPFIETELETNEVDDPAHAFSPESENLYVNKSYSYTLKLPKGIYENCEISESDAGALVSFRIKNGGDGVMWLTAVPFEEGEEDFANKLMVSNDTHSVYVQYPTCGTLNIESDRDLWDKLVQEAREMDKSSISFSA